MKRFSKSYQWLFINLKVKNILEKNLKKLKGDVEKLNKTGEERDEANERVIFKSIEKIEYLLYSFMSKINQKRKLFKENHLVVELFKNICSLISHIQEMNKLQIFWYSQIVKDASQLFGLIDKVM